MPINLGRMSDEGALSDSEDEEREEARGGREDWSAGMSKNLRIHIYMCMHITDGCVIYSD